MASSAVFGLVAAGCMACSTGDDATAGGRFPPRPNTIDLSTIDPCSLFGPLARTSLGLRNATPETFPVDGMPSPGCTSITETDLNYNVQTISIGAERALSDPAASVLQVNGFGAVRSTATVLGSNAPLCQVVVDAAPGGSIRVQVLGTPGGRAYTEDELCRLATDAASLVMTTVAGSG